jgi:hypothetical protein
MAATVSTASTARPPRRRRGRAGPILILILVVIVAASLFALYIWSALRLNYSDGERAGYVQKFSHRGWLCKTWEGELAMVNLPGTTPQIFEFTVRDAATAERINKSLGQRVRLHYDQHPGLPTSCFGETEYFVTDVQTIGP